MKRLSGLHESVLLRKMYLYFLIPVLLFSILSFFFPLLYAIIPAHESSECIKTMIAKQKVVFNIQVNKLEILNTIMFYFLNWCFLLSVILMLNRIRHIRDRFRIRTEMAHVILIWIVASLI